MTPGIGGKIPADQETLLGRMSCTREEEEDKFREVLFCLIL